MNGQPGRQVNGHKVLQHFWIRGRRRSNSKEIRQEFPPLKDLRKETEITTRIFLEDEIEREKQRIKEYCRKTIDLLGNHNLQLAETKIKKNNNINIFILNYIVVILINNILIIL